MPMLTVGSRGQLAYFFNNFLLRNGFDAASGDIFDGKSQEGTKKFQAELQKLYKKQYPGSSAKIDIDGNPGNQTFGFAHAINQYRDQLAPETLANLRGQTYPARPNLPPPSESLTIALFGDFGFDVEPGCNQHSCDIKINGTWIAENIVYAEIPLLKSISKPIKNGKIQVNKLIKAQIEALFKAWERRGLAADIVTFDGAFNARMKRGSTTARSNHAWGTAIDINASSNDYRKLPAFLGEGGSVFDLVPIANDYGFYWGGHYIKTYDGMHFEAVKILTSEELTNINNKYRG